MIQTAQNIQLTPTGLAPYAVDPSQTKGRLIAEPDCPLRTVYQRDRDRILHSNAFRRLKHKTQVFVSHEGDHYRTRLTHSLEVASIARNMARALHLNEDLAETVALAHDLGHAPFGHAGEDALHEVMGPYGGFDHNEQTFRALTMLERSYASFRGLNLSWETLEGIVKHNGPVGTKEPAPTTIANYSKTHDLGLDTYASLEAQIAALSDDIAYHCHDIEDGLRGHLFEIEDVKSIPLVAEVFTQVEKKYPDAKRVQLIYEAMRRLTHILIHDVLDETQSNLAKKLFLSADDIRNHGEPVMCFSASIIEFDTQLRAFLMEHMYLHHKVLRKWVKGKSIIQDLFTLFLEQPRCLPREWYNQTEGEKTVETARIVADYIAGMTDTFAINEHERIYNLYQ